MVPFTPHTILFAILFKWGPKALWKAFNGNNKQHSSYYHKRDSIRTDYLFSDLRVYIKPHNGSSLKQRYGRKRNLYQQPATRC